MKSSPLSPQSNCPTCDRAGGRTGRAHIPDTAAFSSVTWASRKPFATINAFTASKHHRLFRRHPSRYRARQRLADIVGSDATVKGSRIGILEHRGNRDASQPGAGGRAVLGPGQVPLLLLARSGLPAMFADWSLTGVDRTWHKRIDFGGDEFLQRAADFFVIGGEEHLIPLS
jgi:hypothetical protein